MLVYIKFLSGQLMDYTLAGPSDAANRCAACNCYLSNTRELLTALYANNFYFQSNESCVKVGNRIPQK